MGALSPKHNGVQIKKYLMVFLLTFSNIVYIIPYLSLDFYNQFLEAYKITDGQLGFLITLFGITAVPGYFLGGWLADIFSPKKMVVLSTIATALVGFGVAFTSSYTVLMVLYFLYGLTSTMMNWAAYLKVIRMLGADEEQGRLFGSVDIAYGLFSLILESGVLVLVTTHLADNPLGFKLSILIFGGISIIVGLAIQFFIPEPGAEARGTDAAAEADKFRFSLIGKAVRMPITWFLSLFTLGYFIIRSTMPYVNPYITDIYGMDEEAAATIMLTIRTMSLTVMSPLGGFLRDRIGGKATPIVMTGSIGALVFSLILGFIPGMMFPSTIIFMIAAVILIFNSATTSALYTPTAEGKVPIAFTGTVLGIASAIGYSSDIWLYTLCGNWLDNMGNSGYRNIWFLTAAGAGLMVVTGLMLYRQYKKVESLKNEETAA